MAIDLKKARAAVAETGKDLTKPSSGGGDFESAVVGPTRLRLVSLVETGIHTTEGIHGKKRKPRVELGFELSGPKHEPRVLEDGTKIPFRITVKEIVGTTPKNGYIKLFNAMNTDGTARNFVDMLLEGAWRGNVSHYKFKGRDGAERTLAQLKNKGTYEIFPTEFPDPETGDLRRVAVPPALSEPRLFLWDYPDLDQWDSLKIEGVRDDGTSKNYIQEKIKSAENFTGSPIYNLLIEAGREDETVPAGKVEKDDDGEEQGEEGPEASSLSDPTGDGAASAKPPTTKPPAAAGKAPVKPRAVAKPPVKAVLAKEPVEASDDPLAGLD